MSHEASLNEIPYWEYRIINEVVHGHIQEFQDALIAVIAFGPLKTSGDTRDIDLLEVIENWQGPRQFQAESSATLTMRGKLYLNVLSLDDFQLDSVPRSPEVEELIGRVLEGYEIIYERSTGFARDVLAQRATRQKQQKGGALLLNPLVLPFAGG